MSLISIMNRLSRKKVFPPVREYCVICNKTENLKSMQQNYINNLTVENYTRIIDKCFKIKFVNRELQICVLCVRKLQMCSTFYDMILLSHRRLYQNRQPSKLDDNTQQSKRVTVQTKMPQTVLTKKNNHDDKQKHKLFPTNQLQTNVKKSDNLPSKIKLSEGQVSSTVQTGCVSEVDISSDNLDNFSDDDTVETDNWSVTSEEIKIHTGYKRELELSKQSAFVIPILDHFTVECPLCCQTFASNNLLYSHYNKHFSENLCNMCGKLYANSSSFKTHLDAHRGIVKKYPCSLCNKVFRDSQTLYCHRRSFHEKKSMFKCYQCPERFKAFITRKRHMILEHGFECQKYPCTMCDKEFIAANELAKHVGKSHLKIRNYVCPVCNDAFYESTCLRNHMGKHTGTKHHCEFCGKGLSSRKSLREHLKIHKNIKNFKCDTCNKAFVQKCALKSHMKSHYKDPS